MINRHRWLRLAVAGLAAVAGVMLLRGAPDAGFAMKVPWLTHTALGVHPRSWGLHLISDVQPVTVG
jgi:hypothetical protein